MMRGLLADANADGYLEILLRVCRGDEWVGIWNELAVATFTFSELRLDRAMQDDDLWDYCQREGFILLTANRNSDGPRSLDRAIRSRNEVNSFPVLTIADTDRLRTD